MDLEIKLGKEIYQLTHVWHCENKKEFSMGKMEWGLFWVSSARTVVKILPNHSAIFFTPPSVCDITDERKYFPDIGQIDDINDLKIVRVFPGIDGWYGAVSNVITNGTVRLLGKPSTENLPTPDEEKIYRQLMENRFKYRGLVALKETEAEWRARTRIDHDQFQQVDTLTTSHELSHAPFFKRLPLRLGKDLGVGEKRLQPTRILNATKEDGGKDTWRVDNRTAETDWILLRLDSELPDFITYKSEVTINYMGKHFKYRGFQEIYDPNDKSIVFVVNKALGVR